jgi:hypothetical protein
MINNVIRHVWTNTRQQTIERGDSRLTTQSVKRACRMQDARKLK